MHLSARIRNDDISEDLNSDNEQIHCSNVIRTDSKRTQTYKITRNSLTNNVKFHRIHMYISNGGEIIHLTIIDKYD